MTIFVIRWVLYQGAELFLSNLLLVIGYMIIAGLISFAVLYRMGPAHHRTLALIQWTIQLVGLLLIATSSQLFHVSLLMVGVVLVYYNTSHSFLYCL